jgi:hypothetical protein
MKTIEEYKLHYTLSEVIVPENEAEQIVYGLIDEFANDSNSAKYREDITKLMVGLRPSAGKLGYDDDVEAIEVKPVNYTGKGKLDGKGNFSDFTWKRHRKYQADQVRMLVSGFNRGKLLYIVEFPYSSIQHRVEQVLQKKLPNGDIKGTYVRSLTFRWKHWSTNTYTVTYRSPSLSRHKTCFNKKFYTILTEDTIA